jgi:hypothetical protein
MTAFASSWNAQSPLAQQREAVKPFDGFHRAVTPKVFQE